MRRVALLVLLAAIPFPAGCGGSGEESVPAPDEPAAAAEAIDVSATEFAFEPATVEVDEAGSVTFRVVNDGAFPHALEVEGEGVEEETPELAPGESAELTVELADGAYELYCPIGDHRDRGMEGTLTVGGGEVSNGSDSDDDPSYGY